MKNQEEKIEIEKLKKSVFSDDWEIASTAIKRLGEIGGQDILDFLIKLLELGDSSILNNVVLALKKIKNNKAVEPLLKAIFKPENHNYNGTMVYALESLNCETKLVEIFKILFFESYESKHGAYKILGQQIFEFTKDDLFEIQSMWNKCIASPDKYPGFNDDETKLMMEDAYQGFMEYLKEEK